MEEILRVNELARKLKAIDPSNYVLQNPENLDPELLKKVVNAYQFFIKLRIKIPEWAAKKNIIATDIKSIEQCSTPITAQWKFKDLSVKSSLDLTGGFGIDSYYISKISGQHTYNELNSELAQIVKHNFGVLKVDNVSFENSTAEDLVAKLEKKVDLIFIDPDRRGSQKEKLVQIADCTPDLIAIQDQILDNADVLVIKYSPMLDYHLALKQLKHVYKISIIAIKNDVKELVFYASKKQTKLGVSLSTINFTDDSNEIFEVPMLGNVNTEITYSQAKKYLYEPNAAVMKSSLWAEISNSYNVDKIAPNSHFFTSDKFISDFPGRKLQIQEVLAFSKKATKALNGMQANVISRNFGIKPEELRQKFKIKEGDSEFLIFTRDFRGKRVVIRSTKIKT